MKKITHYFILLAVSLGIVSCGTKFLDVDYYTIVNPEGVYEDSSNVFLGLVGVYHALYASGEYLVPHPAVFNLPTLDMQADGWDAEMINHSWTNEARSGFFRTQWERVMCRLIARTSFSETWKMSAMMSSRKPTENL